MAFYARSGVEITLEEWSRLFGTRYQLIASTEFAGIRVSTVWLGLDHNFAMIPGPPIIFETMVFGGGLDQDQRRYHSEAQARAGHLEMVTLARLQLDLDNGVTADGSPGSTSISDTHPPR